MFSTGAKYDTQQIENVVLAYCFNLRMAISSVENKYLKRAFKASLPFGVRSAKSLKAAILEFGIKLEGLLPSANHLLAKRKGPAK
jgi:hypothetical protein